jgi:hypothetical protein
VKEREMEEEEQEEGEKQGDCGWSVLARARARVRVLKKEWERGWDKQLELMIERGRKWERERGSG